MRVPVYFVCAALIFYVKGAYASNYDRIQPLDLTADQETVSYLLPQLTAKYRPSREWNGVNDPRFYLLTEMERNDLDYQEPLVGRIKRQKKPKDQQKKEKDKPGSSLSIVDSLDVLRDRLLLEIARKKEEEGKNRNRQLLTQVGKRAIFGHRDFSSGYDNF